MKDEASLLIRPASELDELCINTLRFLAVDAVEQAQSGHPGMPMGSAAMAYTLWDRFLKYSPQDPHWPDRDRFVLSSGHGCMLLYALLHLTGFDLPLEEIKRFRQWNSMTPGHPEYGKTPGVEATTGPLGQGIGNAVGMAIAETALAARFNRPGHTIVDHYTYVEAGDGDLMEGVSAEAASLAGHLRLGKLILLYADNRISIEGSTEIAFTEDRALRFKAYNWHVQQVEDGNDVAAVAAALVAAKEEKERPSLICVRTHIGFGSPHKQDSAAAHGEPLGSEEARLTKERLGWPLEPSFYIPPEALAHFRKSVDRAAVWRKDWDERFQAYARDYPDLADELRRVIEGRLPSGWHENLPVFSSDQGPIATRSASGKTLNAIAQALPELMGGSADLAPSTKTIIEGAGDYQATNRAGRNMHFGVREHGMGAVVNGMAYHGGLIPYGATFFVFTDYMRPPMRLAALSHLHVIYVLTHDSIGLGEDGPTHQAVEHLAAIRAIPDLILIRPADANETSAAWRIAVEHRNGPVALVLTRQNLPVLDPHRYPQIVEGPEKGGYVLADAVESTALDLILVATGSEVHLALQAQHQLADKGISARVVSLPSTELFAAQSAAYRAEVILPGLPILVLEAGVSAGWVSCLDVCTGIDVVGVDRFGASAPGKTVMNELGLNVENVCRKAEALLARKKEKE